MQWQGVAGMPQALLRWATKQLWGRLQHAMDGNEPGHLSTWAGATTMAACVPNVTQHASHSLSRWGPGYTCCQRRRRWDAMAHYVPWNSATAGWRRSAEERRPPLQEPPSRQLPACTATTPNAVSCAPDVGSSVRL